MRFVTLKIVRDTNHSHSGEYAPWEVPILEVIHEPGNVQELDSVVYPARDLPELNEEWNRLGTRYGKDAESGVFYRDTAYGSGRVGMAALEAAIERERVNSRETAGVDPLAA